MRPYFPSYFHLTRVEAGWKMTPA